MNAVLQRLNIETLLTKLVAWIPSLVAAIIIVCLFWILFRVTRGAVSSILVGAGLDQALRAMLLNVYRVSLVTFGLIMAASQLGINVGAALAGLGVVGLTIGFAAKDTLSNIMAGFLIFWDRPFRVGDWVTLGDKYGKVSEITMRTTRLRTRNNTWVIIPNETVVNQILVNHSTRGQTRIEVPVGIAYKEDIQAAREVILEAIGRVDGLCKGESTVVVSGLGASSVDLLVMVWIPDAEAEKPTYFKVLEIVKVALDQAGIEIPFPHVQLFIDSVADKVWQGLRPPGEDASAPRNPQQPR